MIVVCAYGLDYIDEFFIYYKKYNINNEILVIQNNVDVKKEFLEKVSVIENDLNIKIETYCKENLRELGSWWKGFEIFPNKEWYCFVHDNMFLKFNAKNKVPAKGSIFALSAKNGWCGNNHKNLDCLKKNLSLLGIKNPKPTVIFGCAFICRNEVLNRLKNFGAFNIIAKNRQEACSSERLLGVIFNHLKISIKYEISKIPSSRNKKGVASKRNPVRSSNELFDKIRSVRG
jgi:hypothetical protein